MIFTVIYLYYYIIHYIIDSISRTGTTGPVWLGEKTRLDEVPTWFFTCQHSRPFVAYLDAFDCTRKFTFTHLYLLVCNLHVLCYTCSQSRIPSCLFTFTFIVLHHTFLQSRSGIVITSTCTCTLKYLVHALGTFAADGAKHFVC